MARTDVPSEIDDGSSVVQDIAEQLEVVFDAAGQHRRKDSLSISRRPKLGKRLTSCFVHGFLQDDRLAGSQASHEALAARQHVEDSIEGITGELDDSRAGDKNPHGHEGAGIQSRLLTKKQLSDMAFSIRELSKRLGRFKLKLKVRNVFLLTKAHDVSLIAKSREVAQWLLSKESGGQYNVWVEDTMRDNTRFDAAGLIKANPENESRLRYWTNELCAQKPHTFDIVLALGGDGTVLYSSWLFQRVVPPVISFSLGSLGFLTKFDFGDYQETLNETFHHGLSVSLRLRLEATIMRTQARKNLHDLKDLVEELVGDEADNHHTHLPEQSHNILNDLVIDRGPNGTMSSIEVFGDTYHITSVQADGICVATPTGSTAYNLAAGGSLCHPDNPVVLVTAICAHTLSFRPILLPDTIVLRLGIPYDARSSCWVSFDGKKRVELNPGDYVTISASRFPFPTVLPLGHGGEDWINSLSRTLNWNQRSRQKAFRD